MTDPLHRLKFGALSSYYDQIRAELSGQSMREEK